MTRNFHSFLAVLGLLLAGPAVAQHPRNDGFQRRNGQMHVLRNGQLRPMTQDARLSTGVVVTKDGFVTAANGTRTQLREGRPGLRLARPYRGRGPSAFGWRGPGRPGSSRRGTGARRAGGPARATAVAGRRR